MTLDKLRELGHTLVPFEITQSEFLEMEEVYVAFLNHASMPNLKSLTKKRHEYLMPYYRLFIWASSLPNWLLKFARYFLDKFTVERRLSQKIKGVLSLDHEQVNGLY